MLIHHSNSLYITKGLVFETNFTINKLRKYSVYAASLQCHSGVEI
jgi:hypothetical protein